MKTTGVHTRLCFFFLPDNRWFVIWGQHEG